QEPVARLRCEIAIDRTSEFTGTVARISPVATHHTVAQPRFSPNREPPPAIEAHHGGILHVLPAVKTALSSENATDSKSAPGTGAGTGTTTRDSAPLVTSQILTSCELADASTRSSGEKTSNCPCTIFPIAQSRRGVAWRISQIDNSSS